MNQKGTLIERANPEDAQLLHSLHMASIQDNCSSHYSEAEIQAWGHRPYLSHKWLEAITKDLVLVARQEKGLVGFIHVKFSNGVDQNTDSAWILGLYLCKSVVGQGLGKELFHRAKEYIPTGIHTIKLHSTLNAVGFYRRLGFKGVGELSSVTISNTPIRCQPMQLRLENQIIESYLDMWGLSVAGAVMETPSSLIVPVIGQDTSPLMLKIVSPDDDEAEAHRMLDMYQGQGAARLIRHHGPCQLLERIEPDPSCKDLVQMVLTGEDDQAFLILARAILQLQRISASSTGHLTNNTFYLRLQELEENIGRQNRDQETLALLETGLALGYELNRLKPQYYLHGDLHHYNLLKSFSRGWLAIDPKGILAPVEYDFAIPLCNPYPHKDIVASPKRMQRQAEQMGAYGFSKALILDFAFVHACQVAAWSQAPDCREYWLACAKAAKIARGKN